MNCSNCAAPMAWRSGTNLLECRYCRSHKALLPVTGRTDGLLSMDAASERGCPACGIPLQHGTLECEPVEYCDTCGGILFGSDAFRHVVQSKRARYAGRESVPQPLDSEQLQQVISCPDCQREMEVHPYYGPGNQVIDSCADCRLVWLDPGELTAIEKAPGSRAIG